MHSLTKHIQVALSHMGQQNAAQPQRKFLEYYNLFFLYTATQELIGYRQGKTKLTPG